MTPSEKSRREYPREVRVGELLREVLGSEIERLEVADLQGVVVTGVDVDPELRSATVWIDADEPDSALAALDKERVGFQQAVNEQTRLRHTPVLQFRHDTSIATGNRIEQILSGLEIPPDTPPDIPPDIGDDGTSAPPAGPRPE